MAHSSSKLSNLASLNVWGPHSVLLWVVFSWQESHNPFVGTLKNKLEKLTRGKCHRGMQSLHDMQKLSNIHSSLTVNTCVIMEWIYRETSFDGQLLQHLPHMSFNIFNTSLIYLHHECKTVVVLYNGGLLDDGKNCILKCVYLFWLRWVFLCCMAYRSA